MDFGKRFAEDTEAFIKNGIIMETFPDFYIDKIQGFKGLEAEETNLAFSINDIQVVGYIDAWDRKNNRVIDFKTSGKPWTIGDIENKPSNESVRPGNVCQWRHNPRKPNQLARNKENQKRLIFYGRKL